MPYHRPQPVIPYHLIHGNNAKVDHAHARVDLKEARINTLETDKVIKDTKIAALEASSVGIVDGGRANLQHVEATAINGGDASTT